MKKLLTVLLGISFCLPITAMAACSPVALGGTGNCTITVADVLFGNGTSPIATSSVFTFTTASSRLNVTTASTTNLSASTAFYLPFLATPAGTVLAVNASGQVIATSTASGGVTSVTATWPVLSSGGNTPVISWDGLSTSSAAVVSNIPYFSGVKTFANVATTSLGVTGPITFSGTLGAQIGGANGSFGCATCNTSNATVSSVGLSDSNSTLTIGGTPVTTSGTLTATLNLAHSNQWSVLQDFRGNASSTLSSCLGPCYFGSSATSSFSNAGVLTLVSPLAVGSGGTGVAAIQSGNIPFGNGSSAISTSSALSFASSILTATNASTTALSVNGDTTTGKRYLTFTYATTTAFTGTTTLLQLGIVPIGLTLSSVQCATDAGTADVQYQYGTGPTLVLPMIIASTTVGTTPFTSNNTPVSPNVFGVKIGTPASSPTTVTCTVTAKQT